MKVQLELKYDKADIMRDTEVRNNIQMGMSREGTGYKREEKTTIAYLQPTLFLYGTITNLELPSVSWLEDEKTFCEPSA